jgi:hypothetical protein
MKTKEEIVALEALDYMSIGLAVVNRIAAIWKRSGGGADSLIEYTKVARVEPLCMVDNDVLLSTAISETMQSMLALFSGYYLQAVALSAAIGRINVMKHLDKLNPTRDPSKDIGQAAQWMMGLENYKHRLPTLDNRINSQGDVVSMEAMLDEKFSADIGNDALKIVKESTNLSVGKLINVELSDGQNKGTIPISIRLMAASMRTPDLLKILAIGTEDTSVKERWHSWRDGRISFIKDLCLCVDLVDAHRKRLAADKDGIYTSIIERNRKNQLSALFSGNPSIGSASNLVITSTDSINQLELMINGKFDNFRVREKIFSKTFLMIVAVIDKQWERVTFYHRGLPHGTDISLSDMKVANKGNGPDIGEILKAYQLGNSPQL